MFDWIGNIPLYFWIPLGVAVVGITTSFFIDWYNPLGGSEVSDTLGAISLLVGIFVLPIAGLIAVFSLETFMYYFIISVLAASVLMIIYIAAAKFFGLFRSRY